MAGGITSRNLQLGARRSCLCPASSFSFDASCIQPDRNPFLDHPAPHPWRGVSFVFVYPTDPIRQGPPKNPYYSYRVVPELPRRASYSVSSQQHPSAWDSVSKQHPSRAIWKLSSEYSSPVLAQLRSPICGDEIIFHGHFIQNGDCLEH